MGRRAGRPCAREGCRAWALRGGEGCRAHTPRTALGTGPAEEGGEGSERGGRAAEFARRVASGRYDALLPENLAMLIAEAGQKGTLLDEIGALRVVLAQLMASEQDAGRLSESVPRVVGATVRALKAQRAISGETAGDLTEALTRVLLEMGLGE
ncbi:MAG: hypothetical protein M3Q65_16335 [Chloroflexota bacterium]|nr:hypothetical protein [Chloroflexota bacterium]